MTNNLKGALLTLSAGITWGFSGAVAQYLFSVEGMDSRWLMPVRSSVSGIFLLIICLIKYKPALTFAPWKNFKDGLTLIVYGLIGISGSQFMYYLTIQYSSAGTATILQSLSPIFVLIFGCVTMRRAPFGFEVLSVILALSGGFLITTHGSLSSLAIPTVSLITGLVCAITHMIYNVTPGALMKKYPVPILQTWAFLMGGAFFMLLYRPFNTIDYSPSSRALLGLAFVIFVGNMLAYVIYITGIKYIGPEKSVLYGFAEPVTAALISTLFLGSPFKIWDGIGFALIFGMLVVISVGERLRTKHIFSGK